MEREKVFQLSALKIYDEWYSRPMEDVFQVISKFFGKCIHPIFLRTDYSIVLLSVTKEQFSSNRQIKSCSYVELYYSPQVSFLLLVQY